MQKKKNFCTVKNAAQSQKASSYKSFVKMKMNCAMFLKHQTYCITVKAA